MNEMIQTLNQASSWWWFNLTHAAWQSALLAAAVLALARFGRRWPAPWRHSLLLLALLKFAIPPCVPSPSGLFSMAGPLVQPPRPAWREAPQLAPLAPVAPRLSELNQLPPTQSPGAEGLELNSPNPALQSTRDAKRDLSAPFEPLDWRSWLFLIYLGGIGVGVARLALQVASLRAMLRGAEKVADERVVALFARTCEALELRCPPRLLVSTTADTPLAAGVLDPAIILPEATLRRLSADELRPVFTHELAHFRRRDLWVNWLQVFLQLIWWFNPLLWALNNALRRAREDCCDDVVLSRGLATNDAYCDILLRAAADPSGPPPSAIALALAERLHPLSRRLRRISDQSLGRMHRLSLAGILVVILAGGVLLPGLRSEPAIDRTGPPGSPADLFHRLAIRGNLAKRSQAKLLDQFIHLQPAPVAFLQGQMESRTKTRIEESAALRRKAIWLTGQLGPEAKAAVPALAKLLNDSDPAVAREAAATLASIGAPAGEALPALLTALKNRLYGAGPALVRIAPDSPVVLGALIEALGDRDCPFRDQLVYPLGGLRCDAARVRAALVSALHDEDGGVKRAAAVVLVQLGGDTREANDVLHSARANFYALSAMTKIGPAAQPMLPALLDSMKGPDTRYRLLAANALWRIDPTQTALSVSLLAEGIRRPENESTEQVYFVSRALGEIGPSARAAAPALRRVVADYRDWPRWTAAAALCQIDPTERRKLLPEIISATKDTDRLDRVSLVRTLGELGPVAKSAAPALHVIAETGEPELRPAATAALAKIEPPNSL